MAGHSQFANIMHRKGAQDKRRGRLFTRIIRELTVAARSSGDPNSNPRLRAAMDSAREANVPKDTIERAIRRGQGLDGGEQMEEVRYEGYGPFGTAMILEAVTDNRNRTAGELRAIFTKHGGNLAESNAVAFQFQHCAEVVIAAHNISDEQALELALNVGADNVESSSSEHQFIVAPEQLNHVRHQLQQAGHIIVRSGLVWQPQHTVTVTGEGAQSVMKLLEVLDEHGDVQQLFTNASFDDAELATLETQS